MEKYWDGDLFYRVVEFAMQKHNGQTIKSSHMPYIGHLFEVFGECVNCCLQEKLDVDWNFLMAVSLLHDVLEDTDCEFNELEEKFGIEVAKGVQALSKNESLPHSKRIDDALERIVLERKEVGLVKLADRIVNLQDKPQEWGFEKLKSYKLDAEKILGKLKNYSKILSQRLEHKIKVYL